jgi:methionyl-tRNA formyltransferase
MSLRIVFMGSPDFAIPSLKALHESHHSVVGVVCQTDKPSGRGRKLAAPPAKVFALERGLECYQPKSIKKPYFMEWLTGKAPNVIVVAAYGKIIPPEVLNFPRYGCINVHGSLLPKYRGAAPINWAIINGETETGITIMQMDQTMDTGDILYVEKIPIEETDTAESLFKRLAPLGAKCLMKTIDLLEAEKLVRTPQAHENATFAPILQKEFGIIDWHVDAKAVYDRVRGLYSWPGSRTNINELELKIFPLSRYSMEPQSNFPGTVIWIGQDEIEVACGEGSIFIAEVQPANRNRMKVTQFLQGYPIKVGEVFKSKDM